MKLIDLARLTLSFKLGTAKIVQTAPAVDTAGTRPFCLPTIYSKAARVAVLLAVVGGLLTSSSFATTNPLANAPVLATAGANAAGVLVRGTLSNNPNSTYSLNFYQSLTGNSSDATYIGSSSVTMDGSGNANFFVSFPATVPVNAYLLATATDALNNISDFSNDLLFSPTNAVSLALTMGASSNSAPVGDQVAFTVKLVNSSANAASGIVLQDILPATFQYAYCTASQSTPSAPSGKNLTWNLGTLPAGGSATLTIYASGQNVGPATNFASFSQNEYNLNFTGSSNHYAVNVKAPSAALINLQPLAQLLNIGGLLQLVVGVVGGADTHYQWRLNGANIPGATNAVYLKSVLSILDGGSYTCVISDDSGATITEPVLITLAGLLSLPASDNFASRGAIGLLGTEICNNSNATSEPGEPLHAGVPGGKSLWFKWEPSLLLTKGVATISTAGSCFDTTLAVYTGTSLSNLVEVVSDDDSGGFYTSSVSFNVTPGTTYSIAVDGAYGSSGPIVITTSYNGLAAALPQITTQPTNQIVASNATAAFSVVAGSGSTYQWLHNDVAISGATSANLLVKNVTAASVGKYTVQVTKSSHSIVSKAAVLEISMLDGTVDTVNVASDKFQSDYAAVNGLQTSGTIPLNQTSSPSTQSLAAFTPSGGTTGTRTVNDAGGTSRGYTSTQIFSTYGGATQSGEPLHCGNAGGNSSWTSVQAADNGVLIIDTDGSTFNTVLAVYTGNGNDFSSLQSVACDVGSGQGGTNSRVSFAATSNTVYYIAVDSVNGTAGTVILNANLTVPPTIVAQPTSQTVSPGATVNLAASATGHMLPGCQWWHNGGLLSGATNGTLSITNFQSGKCGTYQMVATNTLGAAVTSPISIFLNTPMRLDSFTFNRATSSCQVRLIGTAGTSYVVQTSPDLIHWFPLATNMATTGIWSLNDSQATNSARYYRAIPGH